jgi:hypothetical protein
MTNTIKGVLLSGLVFPGAGQLAQKHYLRGIGLILGVIGATAVLIAKAEQIAQKAVAQMGAMDRPPDMAQLLDVASNAVSSTDGAIVKTAIVVIIACWLVGMVEAYISGRQLDHRPPELPGAGPGPP